MRKIQIIFWKKYWHLEQCAARGQMSTFQFLPLSFKDLGTVEVKAVVVVVQREK